MSYSYPSRGSKDDPRDAASRRASSSSYDQHNGASWNDSLRNQDHRGVNTVQDLTNGNQHVGYGLSGVVPLANVGYYDPSLLLSGAIPPTIPSSAVMPPTVPGLDPTQVLAQFLLQRVQLMQQMQMMPQAGYPGVVLPIQDLHSQTGYPSQPLDAGASRERVREGSPPSAFFTSDDFFSSRERRTDSRSEIKDRDRSVLRDRERERDRERRGNDRDRSTRDRDRERERERERERDREKEKEREREKDKERERERLREKEREREKEKEKEIQREREHRERERERERDRARERERDREHREREREKDLERRGQDRRSREQREKDRERRDRDREPESIIMKGKFHSITEEEIEQDRKRRRRTIYVGSFPLDTTASALKQIFRHHGFVEVVKIYANFAFVQFSTEEAAEKALASETRLYGRLLTINTVKAKFPIRQALEGRGESGTDVPDSVPGSHTLRKRERDDEPEIYQKKRVVEGDRPRRVTPSPTPSSTSPSRSNAYPFDLSPDRDDVRVRDYYRGFEQKKGGGELIEVNSSQTRGSEKQHEGEKEKGKMEEGPTAPTQPKSPLPLEESTHSTLSTKQEEGQQGHSVRDTEVKEAPITAEQKIDVGYGRDILVRNVPYRASDEDLVGVLEANANASGTSSKVLYLSRHFDSKTVRFTGKVSCTLSTRRGASELIKSSRQIMMMQRPLFIQVSSIHLDEFETSNEINGTAGGGSAGAGAITGGVTSVRSPSGLLQTVSNAGTESSLKSVIASCSRINWKQFVRWKGWGNTNNPSSSSSLWPQWDQWEAWRKKQQQQQQLHPPVYRT